MLKKYMTLTFLVCTAILFHACERDKSHADNGQKEENLRNGENGMPNEPQSRPQQNQRP